MRDVPVISLRWTSSGVVNNVASWNDGRLVDRRKQRRRRWRRRRRPSGGELIGGGRWGTEKERRTEK